MKKIFIFLFIMSCIFLITGCSNTSNNGTTYSGEMTNLSKKYLSKGHAVNIYRSSTPLGDDDESFGKAYITMDFGILTEFTSIADYNPNADYNIKKVIVTNVRIISTPKMGMAEDLYIMKQYSQYISDPHIVVKGTNTKYEIVNSVPNSSGIQTSIMVSLNKIALYDETKSPAAANGNQPTLKQVYDELGITRDEVALKVGFRVELITVSNKTLYKDYEITVPPVGIDITDSQFHYEYYQADISKMEPFLEKN